MKKIVFIAGLGLLSVLHAEAQNTTKKTTTKTNKSTSTTKKKMSNSTYEIKTQAERVNYSLGINIAANLKGQGFDSLDVKALSQGFKDYFEKNELLISEGAAQQILQEYFTTLSKAKYEKVKKMLC